MTVSNVFCACHNIGECDKFSICVIGDKATFDSFEFDSYWDIPLKLQDATVTSFTINDEPGKHLFIVKELLNYDCD